MARVAMWVISILGAATVLAIGRPDVLRPSARKQVPAPPAVLPLAPCPDSAVEFLAPGGSPAVEDGGSRLPSLPPLEPWGPDATPRPFEVEIAVRDGGRPAVGVSVAILDRRIDILGEIATTDPRGEVTLGALPEGDYTVFAYTDAGARTGSSPVVLPRLVPGAVLVELEENPDVPVLVLDDETRSPVAGAVFRSDGPRGWYGGIFPAPPPTDEAGRTWVRCGRLPGSTILPSAEGLTAPGYGEVHVRSSAVAGRLIDDGDTGGYLLLLERPRTLRFPLVVGDGPLPEPGTVVRIGYAPWDADDEPRWRDPPPPESGMVVGTELVIEGADWESLDAQAETPDGRCALLHAEHVYDGAPPPGPVAFRRPGTVEVVLRDQEGNPARGIPVVLSGEAGNIFGQVSGRVVTDDQGMARFRGPLPDHVTSWILNGPWAGGLTGGIRRGTADHQQGVGESTLEDGSARIEATVENEVEILVHVSVGSRPALPPGIWVDLGGDARDVRTTADPESCSLRIRWRPWRPLTERARTLIARAPGFQTATATLEFPPGTEPLAASVELQPAGALLARILLPEGEEVLPALERLVQESGEWTVVVMRDEARRPGPDGVWRLADIDPGSYRLQEPGTELRSGPVEVRPGETALLTFDLRRLGHVSGRVEVPEGEEPTWSCILAESDGLPPREIQVCGDGTFGFRVPGDRPTTLRMSHPVLVPDPTQEAVRVTGSRQDLVFRLVRGPTVVLRVDPIPAIKGWGRDRIRVLVFRGEPQALPFSAHGEIYRDGVFRFGGTPPGIWNLWIDAPGFAPAVLRRVLLSTGETNLGTVPLSGGSVIRIRSKNPGEHHGRYLKARAIHLGEPPYEREGEGEVDVSLAGLGPGRFRVTVDDRMASDPSRVVVKDVESDGRSEIPLDVEFPGR